MTFDVEKAIEELKAAGWKCVRMDVWKSPSGLLYRGPARAWELMKTHPELNKNGYNFALQSERDRS